MDRIDPSSDAVTSSRGVSGGRNGSIYWSGLERNGSRSSRSSGMVSLSHGKSGGTTATSGVFVSGKKSKPCARASSTRASWISPLASAAGSSSPRTSTSILISGYSSRKARSSSGRRARAMLAKQPMRSVRVLGSFCSAASCRSVSHAQTTF